MNNNEHTLEVFILTYNRAAFLGESIKSVLASSFNDFRLTVVDNCSTDNTKEIVDSFNDPRLFYVKHPENIGGINNINSAIKMAKADYIVLFHDDDIMGKDLLKEEYYFLESNPNVGCVSSLTTYLYPDGRLEDVIGSYQSEYKIYNNSSFFSAYFDGAVNAVCPSIMYRRSVLVKYNLFFDPAVGPCCDKKLQFDIERYGYGVASINKQLMYTRVHGNQDSILHFVPMHVEFFKFLKEDPYYGPLLLQEKKGCQAKYRLLSRNLAILEINAPQEMKEFRAMENSLWDTCKGRISDRLFYKTVVLLTSISPRLIRSVYKKYVHRNE